MIPGVGFSELLVIAVLVLLFFGSKELPMLMREAGKLFRKAKSYTDAFKRELDQVTQEASTVPSYFQEIAKKKNDLRIKSLAARDGLTEEQRAEKSAAIRECLLETELVKKAKAIMLYVNIGTEVETRTLIQQLKALDKRIIIPFQRTQQSTLGIAEISDLEKETSLGEFDRIEPIESLRDNFFKSDLQLIICPGSCFDVNGRRMGRGKRMYDNFLRDLRGNVPIWGIAFDCQIAQEQIPFDYHDIAMNQVVTESGFLILDENQTAIANRRL